VQEYIIPECDADDRLIPFKKQNWFIGITSAPSNKNLILSLLSILKFCFLKINTKKKSVVAIPNLKNASDKGETSYTTSLAAMGVNATE
jgi:hypothetical protein